jgi:hypothetical protein
VPVPKIYWKPKGKSVGYLMGKTLILKPLLRSLNSISFMLITFNYQRITTIRILWFCHRSKCNFIYAAIMETNQIYTDLTGRFPTTSRSGNTYILILYDYDSSIILSAPMKNKGNKEMVRSFDLLIQSLIIRVLKPSLQRLDNEAYLALRNYLTKQGINYQLAHPHIHQRNNAERAIQTFKNHFIAGLCSVDPQFPLKLCDEILPQATITYNFLKKSRINPCISAYAQLNGHFDFRCPWRPTWNSRNCT